MIADILREAETKMANAVGSRGGVRSHSYRSDPPAIFAKLTRRLATARRHRSSNSPLSCARRPGCADRPA